jgi:exopolysaccharide production protein ExoZ
MIHNIQGLRAIAVLLVLFSHLFRIEEKYSSNRILPDFFLSGVSGVDLFFVISGFIMVVTTTGKFGYWGNSFKFIYNRATRIFPPYLFYTLIVLTIAALMPGWVNSGADYDLLSSLLLFPSDSAPLLAVGWTLIHEMYFYYVFLFFILFSEKFLLPFLFIWGMIVVCANQVLTLDSPLFTLIFSPLTLEFIFGAFLALYCRINPPKIGIYGSIGLLFASFTLIFLGADYFQAINNAQPSGFWRVLIFGLPAVVILYVIVNLESKNIKFPDWVMKIGDSSYSTYLTHVLVLSALGRIWMYFSVDSDLYNVVAMLILVVSCLIYGWLSYIFLEKNMLKASRRLYRNVGQSMKTRFSS